jgi:hypothetical protein
VIGTLFKYTMVAVIGGIGFAFATQCMDSELIESIKSQLAVQEKANSDLTPDELKAKMQMFIETNRSQWTSAITLASNLKVLNTVLDAWY